MRHVTATQAPQSEFTNHPEWHLYTTMSELILTAFTYGPLSIFLFPFDIYFSVYSQLSLNLNPSMVVSLYSSEISLDVRNASRLR